MGSDPSTTRRALLGAAGGAITATSGCLGDVQNLVGRERIDQLSLTISTPPAQADPYAARIASRLAENLQDAGIDASVDPIRPDVLFQDILINHDFDLYVARYPSQDNPDELRSMLYSQYAEEAGWQNPFGFSDLTFDDLLDDQRTAEENERAETIHDIQRQIVREQPFTVICSPDHIGAIRNDRFSGWPAGGPKGPTDYLQLDGPDSEMALELLIRNDRITRNKNPIAAEYRDQGYLTGLLYDSLIRNPKESTEPINWLAETIDWEQGDTLSATVTLRETPWHDGESVTADDVAFTYEFLRDTSLGEFDTPAPTPWRRGRPSLVESTEVETERQVRFEFITKNRSVARQVFLVPILPRHIWRDRAEPADLVGVDIVGQTTEALISSNEEAIGSGPLRFVDAETDASLSLETFHDHFLYSGHNDGIPDQYTGDSPFAGIEFTVTPSHDAAVQILTDDGADATADTLQASVVPSIVRENDVSLTVRQIDPFYHIGYNCRRAPMVDPNFRRAIARHLDREAVVDTSLEGYGFPSETPLSEQWVPADLQWDGEATLPFFGSNGELDAAAAREAFQDAGYQYDGDELIRRGGE